MPTGAEGAKKAGDFSGRTSFVQKPRGITYFKLANDQDEAIVRFLNQHGEINWVRQWKTAAKPGFPFGEKIPCVDQYEDGTPDPGYAANLKTAWTGYLPLIWRQAPQFQRNQDGSFVKDGNQNKIFVGYADDIALWEISYPIFKML
jgi:hypothetical protein